MLQGKTVVLGITGSIAAYKIAGLTSLLKKQHANVHVIMTKNAMNFIQPITFETLTGNKCLTDTFGRDFEFHVEHVSLAKQADVFVVAPASANIIGKIAGGIADDMLTTTVMAATCPKIIVPAMNTYMWENPIVQENIERLNCHGYRMIDPVEGLLACGDIGKGKMPEPDVIMEYILREIACEKDLAGKKILVTAGPTMESIDPVRFISNHSTGTMGYALAYQAMLRGADVTLITGKTYIQKPAFVKIIEITSAEDMLEEVGNVFENQDILIMSAAVADYRPKIRAEEKIKKHDETVMLELEQTTDILKDLSERKQKQFICGFSMETENIIENSREKLYAKNLDMICANNLKEKGAGFGLDTNAVWMITKDEIRELPLDSKYSIASGILDFIKEHRQ